MEEEGRKETDREGASGITSRRRMEKEYTNGGEKEGRKDKK